MASFESLVSSLAQNAVVSQVSHLGLPSHPLLHNFGASHASSFQTLRGDLLGNVSSAVASASAVTRPSSSRVRPALRPLTNQRFMMNFSSNIRAPAPSFLGTTLPVSSQPTATSPSTVGLSDNVRLSNCNLVRALNPCSFISFHAAVVSGSEPVELSFTRICCPIGCCFVSSSRSG